MFKKNILIFIIIVLIFILQACANNSRLEVDYGTSFHLLRFNQILNIDTFTYLAPLHGLDGKVSQSILENYLKSLKVPSQKPVLNFNIKGLGQ